MGREESEDQDRVSPDEEGTGEDEEDAPAHTADEIEAELGSFAALIQTLPDEIEAVALSEPTFAERFPAALYAASSAFYDIERLPEITMGVRTAAAKYLVACRRLIYASVARGLALAGPSSSPPTAELAVISRLYCAAVDGWNVGLRDLQWFDDGARDFQGGHFGELNKSFHPADIEELRSSVAGFVAELVVPSTSRSIWRRYTGPSEALLLRPEDLPGGFDAEPMASFGEGARAFHRRNILGRESRVYCHAFLFGDIVAAQAAASRLRGQHEKDEQERVMHEAYANMRVIPSRLVDFDITFGDFGHAMDGKVQGVQILTAVVRLANVAIEWGSVGLKRSESLDLLDQYLRRLSVEEISEPPIPTSPLDGLSQPLWSLALTELDLPRGFSLREEEIDGAASCQRSFAHAVSTGYSPAIVLNLGFAEKLIDASAAFDGLAATREAIREAWSIEDLIATAPVIPNCRVLAQTHAVDGRAGAWVAIQAGRFLLRISTDGVHQGLALSLARTQLERVLGPLADSGLALLRG